MSTKPNPKRGEIWFVDLEPVKGAELQKKRPAVVISSDALGVLPIKLIVPITEYQDSFDKNDWHIKILPDSLNGLKKASAIDCLQVRAVDLSRFDDKIGAVTAGIMVDVTAAIAMVIEYA